MKHNYKFIITLPLLTLLLVISTIVKANEKSEFTFSPDILVNLIGTGGEPSFLKTSVKVELNSYAILSDFKKLELLFREAIIGALYHQHSNYPKSIIGIKKLEKRCLQALQKQSRRYLGVNVFEKIEFSKVLFQEG